MTTATVSRQATEKQRAFVTRLLSEKDVSGTAYEGWVPDWSRATSATASSVIDYLLNLPRKASSPAPGEPKAGIYWIHGDHLVRVYLGQRSGKMLVKRIHTERDGDETIVSYEYLGAASRVLTPAATPQRLPLEEVGSLGLAFNHCLVCGRRLDDPESVDQGIGPVCARKY